MIDNGTLKREPSSNESLARERWIKESFAAGVKIPDRPVCDICSKPINLMESYCLTIQQVTTSEAYWVFSFKNQQKNFDQYPEGDLVADLAIERAKSTTAWYVCESCSTMFIFDRDAARRYSVNGLQTLPGDGPVNVNRVATAAAYAWKSLYGSFPNSISFK